MTFVKGQVSSFKGKHHTQKAIEQNRLAHIGKRLSPEAKNWLRKIVLSRPDFRYYWQGRTGDKSANWKGGLPNRVMSNERNNSAYKEWVRLVKKRDKNICKLKDKSCSGYNIVHHIKSWKCYPELRYKINNGITLCQAHHPKKRAEEKQLEDVFQNLIE